MGVENGMKKELDYFRIGRCYGGNQDWFWDLMMRMGGCGALAACESCIFLQRSKGREGLYPFDALNLTKKDYVKFGMQMKPYLMPRNTGINTLDIYIDGFSDYLLDCGRELRMEPFSGAESAGKAKKVLQEQIDHGFLVPCLLLHHKDRGLKDYDWHWFLLTGYETFEDICMVKAVTYGKYEWIDFDRLWDTGYEEKGGLILYRD